MNCWESEFDGFLRLKRFEKMLLAHPHALGSGWPWAVGLNPDWRVLNLRHEV
jgi:hypothetical protein